MDAKKLQKQVEQMKKQPKNNFGIAQFDRESQKKKGKK